MFRTTNNIILGIIFFLTSMLCVVGLSCVENQTKGIEEKTDNGFVSIFNGENLHNWDGDPRMWFVKDDAIHGISEPAERNSFCVWRGGKLRNFVLKIKYRIGNGYPDRWNSGIQFRSSEFDKWRVRGYQAEIEATPIKAACLNEERGGKGVPRRGDGGGARVGQFTELGEDGVKRIVGIVVNRNDLIEKGYYKEDDWNEYTITARGNHIIQHLNGYQTVEFIDNDPVGCALEGVLALQIHRGPSYEVEFKDIRLKNSSPVYGYAKRLFNGENFDGWDISSPEMKNAWTFRDTVWNHTSPRPADTWSFKERVIVSNGEPAGYISTNDDYTNFVLRLQYRNLSEGDAGILLRAVKKDDEIQAIKVNCRYSANGKVSQLKKFPSNIVNREIESNEKEIGKWNQLEIILDKGDLEVTINDVVKSVASNCWEIPGKIGLFSDRAQIEFRNIVITPILKVWRPPAKH